MLVIRSEQMRALQAARLEQFERYAIARVEADMPQRAFALPALATQVRLGVARGLRHFSTEHDVARYVEIVLRHLGGWTVDDHPVGALEMIRSASLPAGRRLDNFERWAKARAGAHAV